MNKAYTYNKMKSFCELNNSDLYKIKVCKTFDLEFINKIF